ncbi:hypothetical protein BCV70DRAFT_232833 [Testicularia cyperi]|uniref:Protein MON2 homolog n=1 Tax=Testicularia cyperi TaxID=1882483 RepID=A0A317XKF7_9BASI|nr:hypothetical protein BCV70DRAFT_232833 [Testicularia cyperi]
MDCRERPKLESRCLLAFSGSHGPPEDSVDLSITDFPLHHHPPHSLLVSELTALSSEAKRKHPEIKQAADAFLARLKSDSESTLTACRTDAGPATEHPLLKPVLLSCDSKLPKVVSLAMGLLQRILLMKLVPDSAIPTIISGLHTLLSPAARTDVDVQLKILQIASALLSSYPSIHDQYLADTLMLGFRLQEGSKVAVVSSTAAATLRQSVMSVFDKVKDEDAVLDAIKDGGEEAAATAPLAAMSVDIPDMAAPVTLFPSSRDAYLLFSDLCSLASGEHAGFLSLASLSRTFSLELIESVLTNHPRLFSIRNSASTPSTHPELLYLLRSKTCPLLIKTLSEPPAFPVYLRLMRILFLLLRQFSADLVLEVEILMSILLRSVSPTAQDLAAHGGSAPSVWQQVLALEVVKSLCSDDVFLRSLWEWFDAGSSSTDASAKIFAKLIESLQSVVMNGEKLFAKDSSMNHVQLNPGLSSAHESPRRSRIRQSFDRSYSGLVEAAAGVASAAMSGVFSSSESQGTEILSSSSSPAVQIIDQLDKSDPPSANSTALPRTYPQLLALQSFLFLTQSMAAYALPIYSKFVNARPADAAAAPAAMQGRDLAALAKESDRVGLTTTVAMLRHCSVTICDVLARYLRVRCTDAIFEETLLALRNLTNATGALGLLEQRNVILLQFITLSVPGWDANSTVSLHTLTADPDTVSNRNLACLRALIQVVYYLSGSLGSFWAPVLSGICSAQFLVSSADNAVNRRGLSTLLEAADDEAKNEIGRGGQATLSTLTHTTGNTFDIRTGKTQLQLLNPSDLQLSRIDAQILEVFQNTTALDATALTDFLTALCHVCGASLEAVNLTQSDSQSSELESLASPRSSGFHGTPSKNRNRTASRTNEDVAFFPLAALELVAELNIRRLCRSDSTDNWMLIVSQLTDILVRPSVTSSWRVQAARVINAVLISTMAQDVHCVNDEEHRRLQGQVFSCFERICILEQRRTTNVDIDIRRMSIEKLNKVLETFGHSLLHGWEAVFSICSAACAPPSEFELSNADTSPMSKLSQSTQKALPGLIKAAFACLQLLCSDFLPQLTVMQLRICISTLKGFSRQQEEVNVSLTANGCLWAVTAEMASRKNLLESASNENATKDLSQGSDLWLFLLQCLLDVSQDSRSEVRNGSISSLFRVLQQYGETLDVNTWVQICNIILFPLIESLEAMTTHSDQLSTDVDYTRHREEKDRTAQLLGHLPSHAKQWQESHGLALTQSGQVVRDFLVSKLVNADAGDFERIWDKLLVLSRRAFLHGTSDVAHAAILCLTCCLEADVVSVVALSDELTAIDVSHPLVKAWLAAWESWVKIGQTVGMKAEPEHGQKAEPTPAFTQKNLVAYVQVFDSLYRVIKSVFDAKQADKLLRCLAYCLSYTESPDQVNDAEKMTALQDAARSTARLIREIPGTSALALADLAAACSLAYQPAANASSTRAEDKPKPPTFVALSRSSMYEASEFFAQSSMDPTLYREGALRALLVALSAPIRLKYHGPDLLLSSGRVPTAPQPLWQQATIVFCRIVSLVCPRLGSEELAVGTADVADFWTSVVEVIEIALLADPKSSNTQERQHRELDERFGLTLLSTLELSILPHLGSDAVSDGLLTRIATSLVQASRQYSLENEEDDIPGNFASGSGRMDDITPIASERLNYWYFDLLFLSSSKGFAFSQGKVPESDSDTEKRYRRLASVFIPHLSLRATQVLSSYTQDAALRGMMPLPRIRNEEVNYVLTRLIDLQLWPGSFSTPRSQPEQSESIWRDSPRAHLFGAYKDLVALLHLRASPGSTPITASAGTSLPSILPEDGSFERELQKHGLQLGLVGRHSNPLLGSADSIAVTASHKHPAVFEPRDLAYKALSLIGTELGVLTS